MVANHRAALAIRARRPIVAGCILGSGNRCAVLLSSGKHVVLVGSVTATIDHHALLIESRLFVDLILVAVKVRQIHSDLHALSIEPRAVTNPVLGANPTRALSRKISAPRLASCATGLSEALTVAGRAPGPPQGPHPYEPRARGEKNPLGCLGALGSPAHA